MVKINLGNFKIDLFDHGVIATVHFRLEAAIKEIWSFKPTWSVELADELSWFFTKQIRYYQINES